jgi:CheY-specific phosphatase CheX
VPEFNLSQAVSQATEDVLSTMFFTFVDEVPADAGGQPDMETRIAFRGHLAGSLALQCSTDAVAEMASNFLGLEADTPPSAAEQEAVMTELANMICGAILSRIGSEGLFELLPPDTCGAASSGDPSAMSGSHCVERTFGVGLGALRLKFRLDDAP